jgi:hypothetical protein
MSSSPELRNSHRRKMAGMHHRLKALLSRYRLLETVTKKEREMSEKRRQTIERLRNELSEEQQHHHHHVPRTPEQRQQHMFHDSPSLVRCIQMQKDVKIRRDFSENLGLNVQKDLEASLDRLQRESTEHTEKVRIVQEKKKNKQSGSPISRENARIRAEFDILSMSHEALKHRYEQKCQSTKRAMESNAKALKLMSTEYESMCNIVDKSRKDDVKLSSDVSSLMMEQKLVTMRNESITLEGELKISRDAVRFLESNEAQLNETIEREAFESAALERELEIARDSILRLKSNEAYLNKTMKSETSESVRLERELNMAQDSISRLKLSNETHNWKINNTESREKMYINQVQTSMKQLTHSEMQLQEDLKVARDELSHVQNSRDELVTLQRVQTKENTDLKRELLSTEENMLRENELLRTEERAQIMSRDLEEERLRMSAERESMVLSQMRTETGHELSMLRRYNADVERVLREELSELKNQMSLTKNRVEPRTRQELLNTQEICAELSTSRRVQDATIHKLRDELDASSKHMISERNELRNEFKRAEEHFISTSKRDAVVTDSEYREVVERANHFEGLVSELNRQLMSRARQSVQLKRQTDETSAHQIALLKREVNETSARQIAQVKREAEETSERQIAQLKLELEETSAHQNAQVKKEIEETSANQIAQLRREMETSASQVAKIRRKMEDVVTKSKPSETYKQDSLIMREVNEKLQEENEFLSSQHVECLRHMNSEIVMDAKKYQHEIFKLQEQNKTYCKERDSSREENEILQRQHEVSATQHASLIRENTHHVRIVRDLNCEIMNAKAIQNEVLNLREMSETFSEERDALKESNKALRKRNQFFAARHASLIKENEYHLQIVGDLNSEMLDAKTNRSRVVENLSRELTSHEIDSDVRDRELMARLRDAEARCLEWHTRSEQSERALQRAQMLRDIRESETSSYHEQSVALWAETKKRRQEVLDLSRVRDEQEMELNSFRSKLIKNEDEIAKYVLEKKRNEESFFGGFFNSS